MASLSVNGEDRNNNHDITSIIARIQVYYKMNAAAYPTRNAAGKFERPPYDHIYFLDPEDAVTKIIQLPLKHGISATLIKVLEQLKRSYNMFAQGFMMKKKLESFIKVFLPPQVHFFT